MDFETACSGYGAAKVEGAKSESSLVTLEEL